MNRFVGSIIIVVLLFAGSFIAKHYFTLESSPTTSRLISTSSSAHSQLLYGQKLNINDATQEALELIPGIGPSLAGKIVDYRETHGSFLNLGQLMEIKGIGEKKLEVLKKYLTCE